MSKQSWTLINTQQGIYQSDFNLSRDGFNVGMSRLVGGIRQGVDVLTIETPKLKIEVLPTRGMSIWKAWYRGHEFGWQSPVQGPVHPSFVPLNEPSGLGWLDGFDEMMVRCGLESNGAPEFDEDGRLAYPLHGRIGNKPANEVSVEITDSGDELTIESTVEEIRFHFFKLRLTTSMTISKETNQIRIRDRVENLSESPTTMQMLYHVNFGNPVLDAGAKFIAPLKEVVPRNDHAASNIDSWQDYGPPVAGFEEQVYFMTMHADTNNRTKVLLRNAHGIQGVSIDYRIDQLPCFSVWKNTTSLDDGYVTGIEPGTNYPNPRSYETEQGRVGQLDSRGHQQFDLTLSLLADEEEVSDAESAVNALSDGRETITHDRPQSGWCADA